MPMIPVPITFVDVVRSAELSWHSDRSGYLIPVAVSLGGNSLAAIASGLNADRIPTAQGGRRWYPARARVAAKTGGRNAKHDECEETAA
jgi:hypothetical protein